MIKPSRSTSNMGVQPQRIVAFDTESTGVSNSDQIIEFGAVEIIDGKICRTFQRYIKPSIRIPADATRVHGITNAMLKNAPSFEKVAEDIFLFVKGAKLVAHNAAFDCRMMKLEGERHNIEIPPEFDQAAVIDTMKMAQQKWPGKRIGLDALLDRLGIDRSSRVEHGALLDSMLLAKAYLAFDRGQVDIQLRASEGPSLVSRIKRVVAGLPLVALSSNDVDEHNRYVVQISKNPAAQVSFGVNSLPPVARPTEQDQFADLIVF